MEEEQKIKIVKKFLEILPHRDEVRNKFGGVNRIFNYPEEVINNLLELIFQVDKQARIETQREEREQIEAKLYSIEVDLVIGDCEMALQKVINLKQESEEEEE